MTPGAQLSLPERWAAALMGTYSVPALELVAGAGARVRDSAGRTYLDLLGGIAVSSLGHNHPAVVAAVCRQAGLLAHTSNLYAHEPAVALAERLLALLGHDGRVFLCNSGAEAVECALKISRRHGRLLDPDGGRLEVVAAEGSFHGRTLGALSVTGQPAKRAPFEPLLGTVTFVPYGDAAALHAAVTSHTAAVLLEPVQGENGVVVPPAGYLAAARSACDATGALLVLDEVQGGIGRTGRWFSHQHPELGAGVRPDVVTLAKGLGGGLPIGACVGIGPAGHLLQKGEHGSTFGGNPVSCAAALAVLDTLADAGVLANARAVGARLADGIRGLDHPLIAHVRGAGLWLGIVLTRPVAAQVEATARAAGFLVNAPVPDALRLAPPLLLTAAEADEVIAALPGVLDAAIDAAIDGDIPVAPRAARVRQ